MNHCIDRVEICTIRIPLPRAVFLGETRITHREFAVAVVESSDGLRGWGHTFTRGAPVAVVAKRCFASLLLGEDANLTSRLWAKMAQAASLYGAEGLAMRAISILDIALWDLKARRANLPLYQLLGGFAKRVPLLVPCGYRREGDSSDYLQNELQHYRDSGVTAVKTMFSPNQLKSHAASINQARTLLGNDIMLGNDFLATGENACRLLQALEAVTDAKLDFVEDPLPLSNRQEFGAFRDRWRGVLVTGETVSTLTAAQELCGSGWINAARFDATACGGVSAWMRMHALAVTQQQPVWPHCFPEIHAHLAAATGAPFVESPLPTYETVNFGAVLTSPLPIVRGFYELPTQPGLGLELDDEKLRAFCLKES